MLATDESYAFTTRSKIRPVIDAEYFIEQDQLGVIWPQIFTGIGGAYSNNDIYAALIYNFGYLNNEDLYNIAIDENTEYNFYYEGRGFKLITLTDRFAFMLNQRKYVGITDNEVLDLTTQKAMISIIIYDRGNSLRFNSAANRLLHDIYPKNACEIGLVWRTENPGWISLFSGIELGVAALYDFEKGENDRINFIIDIGFGSFYSQIREDSLRK